MGDAFVASANNAEAMFWNPAGIAQVKNDYDIALGYNKWIFDIKHQYAGFVYNADKLGTFGLNMTYVDYGEIEGTRRSDSDPNGYIETGTFTPKAYVVGLTYAKSISDKFSFGGNIKYVRQDLGSGYVATGTSTDTGKFVDNKLGQFALDFGILYFTGFKDLRLGVTITNLSLEKGFIKETFPLPIAMKIGLAMDVLRIFDVDKIHKLTVEVDALHLRDYTERMHFGAEYTFDDKFFVRAGYKTNYDEDKFSAGFGVKVFDAARIDYSFSPFGRLDPVQRVSIGYQL
jgi:long-subunit fatty acid transport protein